VSPAGNESSPRAYWPAAHPDVFGVAATNRMGNGRAWFSNWGPWADCCVRGQDVASTYIYWLGSVEGEPPEDVENFLGWARWDGTSFAAPKLAAEIARRVSSGATSLSPFETAVELISGAADHLTDTTLWPPPGVPLPHLHLG
jgi:thermitase